MKRLNSSDSLVALMTVSVCPTSDKQQQHTSPRTSHVYGRDFRSMLDGLDEEGCVEELSLSGHHVSEKKRRLSVDQVKALEKNFEVENKLEPERKVKLAQDLGLQPRQVAVWFQNRRARWKTKQLERDYSLLKANYDSLKLNFDQLHRDNQTLLKQIKEMKSKLDEDNNVVESDELVLLGSDDHCENDKNKDDEDDDVAANMFEEDMNIAFVDHFRDGSSDSDSSAVLNDENIVNKSGENGVVVVKTQELMANDMSSTSSYGHGHGQAVKLEEHNFFSGEETTCNFFSDDQPPSLHWYCGGEDQWD